MTRTEHLLTIVAEECAEVSQRITKILRFGATEIQPGQDKDNIERLLDEFNDLYAMMMMLKNDNLIPWDFLSGDKMANKIQQVEKFLEYSRKCGTLTDS